MYVVRGKQPPPQRINGARGPESHVGELVKDVTARLCDGAYRSRFLFIWEEVRRRAAPEEATTASETWFVWSSSCWLLSLSLSLSLCLSFLKFCAEFRESR